MNSKFSKILSLGLFTSVMSVGAFAEPTIQPGETLESLSKAKISTKVNGQEGSLESLVNSGQIRLVDPRTVAPQPAMPNTPAPMSNDPAMTQAPNSGTVPQPAMVEPGMNEAGVEANMSMAAPQPQPALEEQQTAAITSEQSMPEEQQAAVIEAEVSNEQAEVAVQSDAEPVQMEEPLNAAPEMPAAVELEQ
ncbi:hypothetical protein VXQ92_10235 [Acinetobacter sp. 228]|uniref:hypothetical protein n=1 Tax=Acinetobacter sp. 228 TaxID=3114700 RepID=UPI003A8A3BA7